MKELSELYPLYMSGACVCLCVCVSVPYTPYTSISWDCLVKKQIHPRFTEFLVVGPQGL